MSANYEMAAPKAKYSQNRPINLIFVALKRQ